MCKFLVDVCEYELVTYHLGQSACSHWEATVPSRIAIWIQRSASEEGWYWHHWCFPYSSSTCIIVLWHCSTLQNVLGTGYDAGCNLSESTPNCTCCFVAAGRVLPTESDQGIMSLATSRVRIWDSELPRDGVAINGISKGKSAATKTTGELFAWECTDRCPS